jgi:uncharacterized protein YsxB (DUF464 family)
MMDVRINPDKLTVIATGHANAPRNEDGRDLVCCAVSTLMQTLIYSCQELRGVLVNHDVKPGDLFVQISAPNSQTDAVKHRMTMLHDGIKALADQYPMCVKLK